MPSPLARRSLIAIASTASAVLALGAGGQTTAPADDGGLPLGAGVDGRGEAAGRRTMLLREGSVLVAVSGTLEAGPRKGWWQFRMLAEPPNDAAAPMPLLPCALLASLEEIVEGSGPETVFEMTGEVFVYRRQNYLLPTHSPRVASYTPPPDAGADRELPADGGERPQDIIRRMEREIGPVPRLPAGTIRPADRGGGSRLLREGTLIAWRRGWMTREPGGAWEFTFAPDADGLEDPPVVLLPCLLLERLEQRVEQTSRRQALLVSGRVYRYGRRNYLLPTAFQVPRERTPLRP